jgi:23S rRNA (pseudouridine1915-N3)-methyltransferase
MIKIICVGKIKEKYFKEAILEYEKRISKYSKIESIECNDYSDMDVNSVLEKEKLQLERHINEKDYVVTLEVEGTELSSLELSKKIDSIFLVSSNLVFIVGGSHGLHHSIKERSNFALSFSKLTFPHQLFRIILLEQIYRSFRILNNENYHK